MSGASQTFYRKASLEVGLQSGMQSRVKGYPVAGFSALRRNIYPQGVQQGGRTMIMHEQASTASSRTPGRRTKIVCTIGPATTSAAKLRQLIEAGADVLRLNFSHGTPAEHATLARRIRTVAAELGKPVALLQDLPGPKIRLGEFPDGPVVLKPGETFTLTGENVPGTLQGASVNYPQLVAAVEAGDTLLLADGTVELRVEAVEPPEIRCRVILGGTLSSHKGITVPHRALPLQAFTEQDQQYMTAGFAVGFDLAALSFVQCRDDIIAARRFLTQQQVSLPLMAKIEKPQAVANLEDILTAVDAVMVARGDLGVEIPLEEVPLVQKDLIAQARQLAKPVITATHMLGSMVHSPHPTRAEATDVVNAVLDGTDAVMLSEESAIGAYPVEAVHMLARLLATAEQRLIRQGSCQTPRRQGRAAALGHAACMLAADTGAAAIVCYTHSGRTADWVATQRPQAPIIAVSPFIHTVQRLMLTWGVHPVLGKKHDSPETRLDEVLAVARQTGLLRSGDGVVVVGGADSATVAESAAFLRVLSLDERERRGT